MPFPDEEMGNFILKRGMSLNEYLDALAQPPGYLVGGPSVTYDGRVYAYTQLFERPKIQDETKSAGGTRHRRKRNKKTRKAF